MAAKTSLRSLGLLLASALMWTACETTPTTPSGPGGPAPSDPDQEEVAVFLVAGEAFRVRLSTPELRQAARAVWAGSPARIPIGRILPGTEMNAGWTWHLADVALREAAAEVCDGRPSDVERGGAKFGNGWFCPWSAELVAIVLAPAGRW